MPDPPSAWRRERRLPTPRGDAPALLGLLALVLVLYGRPLLDGTVYFERDVQLMWLTHARAFVEAVRLGEWPTWNPWIALGQPLWADANTQVLYPPTWLLLILAPWRYYVLFVVAHMLLAGTGAYALARTLAFPRTAAWVTAAIWVCSGPVASQVPIWNQLAGAAWMPWTIHFALQGLRMGRMRAVLLWGCGHALQILAGAPEAVLMTGAGIAAAALWMCMRPSSAGLSPGVRTIGSFVIAGAVALGLSAGQWLPSVEVARRSGRGEMTDAMRTQWSVHPAALSQAVLPIALPDVPLGPSLRRGIFEATDLVPSLYLGAATLGLAGLALGGARRTAAAALLLCVAATVAIAVGRHAPFDGALGFTIPWVRSFRYPVKAMVAASLAWALLCGLGVDAWRLDSMTIRARRRALTPLAALSVASLALLVVLAGYARARSLPWSIPVMSEAAARAMLFPVFTAWTAATALLLLGTLRRPSGRVVAIGAALAVADLVIAHATLNPTAPAALFTQRPAAAAFLAGDSAQRIYVEDYFASLDGRRHLGRLDPYAVERAPVGWTVPAARALAMRWCLFPPSAGAWGLRGSFDRDTPALSPQFLSGLTEAVSAAGGTPDQVQLLRIGAVSHLVTLHRPGAPFVAATTVDCLLPEPGRIVRVPDTLPRTRAVGRAREGDTVRALLDPGFDPARDVLLAGHGRSLPPASAASFRGEARVVTEKATRVRVSSLTSSSGYVVLADAYDPGWVATVDGRPVEVLRADVGFRAVAVPSGPHDVEFRYEPPAVRVGLLASALSAAVVLALSIGAGSRRA